MLDGEGLEQAEAMNAADAEDTNYDPVDYQNDFDDDDDAGEQ